jgi:hypothetical protein
MNLVKPAFLLTALCLTSNVFADAKSELMAAYDKTMAVKAFRATSNIVTGKHQMKSVAEVVWPDRFHITTDDVETIVLPGASYMKQGGKWMKLPMDMSMMTKQFSADAMKKNAEAMTNIKAEGVGNYAGEVCNKYSFDVSMKIMGVQSDSHQVSCVSNKTGLVIHISSDGKAMGKSTHSEVDYVYDSTIEIKAPI